MPEQWNKLIPAIPFHTGARVATNYMYARRQPLCSGPCDLRPQFYDFPPFYLLTIHQSQTLISSMQISLHSKVTHSILIPQFFNETVVLKCRNHCTVICLHRKCQKIILANDYDDDGLFHEHIQCLIDGFKLTEREWCNGDETLWPILNDRYSINNVVKIASSFSYSAMTWTS